MAFTKSFMTEFDFSRIEGLLQAFFKILFLYNFVCSVLTLHSDSLPFPRR